MLGDERIRGTSAADRLNNYHECCAAPILGGTLISSGCSQARPCIRWAGYTVRTRKDPSSTTCFAADAKIGSKNVATHRKRHVSLHFPPCWCGIDCTHNLATQCMRRIARDHPNGSNAVLRFLTIDSAAYLPTLANVLLKF